MAKGTRWLALGALVMAGAANAGIYKCTENGAVVFSQTPCSDSAEKVEVRTYTPDPEEVRRQQERVEQSNKKLDAAIEQREVDRNISKLQRKIRGYQRRMDSELSALRRKKLAANNNLAGAAWEQSISDEMKAVTEKYKTKIQVTQSEIDSLRAGVQ